MPNTLAHLGIQALATRTVIKDADLKWIGLGCLIPDIPWIAQRLILLLGDNVNVYTLRLYLVVQAALFFCLFLCAAFALFTESSLRIFSILSLNALLHLILDAMQTKWGGGVHIIAPLNWNTINFQWFWPESLISDLLTALGIILPVRQWRFSIKRPTGIKWPPDRRWFLGFGFLAAYIVMPFFFLPGVFEADSHFVKTLGHTENRAGRSVAFDRNTYLHDLSGGVLVTFAGEKLHLEGRRPTYSGQVSLRGRFSAQNRIQVTDYHMHSTTIRDGASYAGICVILALWAASLARRRIMRC